MSGKGQKFEFSLVDSLIAEVGGVAQPALHLDIDAICHCYEAIMPVAERLGIDPPRPRLAGLAYPHISTIGCEVHIKMDAAEPWVDPCIHTPEDIDNLREPDDYMSVGIISERLRLVEQLKARRPDASDWIGHEFEGPITTAVLMMGQDFFLLPYEDPKRAHKLLDFVTRSALNYVEALAAHRGRTIEPNLVGIPDDFAGMLPPDLFGEFVVPYWNMLYEGMKATERHLHSELLREAHMPFLEDVKIDIYDPSVDQYLPADVVARSCPCAYELRLWPAWVMAWPVEKLVDLYREFAGYDAVSITFAMGRLSEEPKIQRLLEVARELA